MRCPLEVWSLFLKKELQGIEFCQKNGGGATFGQIEMLRGLERPQKVPLPRYGNFFTVPFTTSEI
jgi:hypothetical protein